MADKKFIKGLFKDTGHIDQPEGTWRHARNMILNEKMGSISNEGGTEINGNLIDENNKVVGSIAVTRDKVVLFVTDVVTPIVAGSTAPRSEIGVWENGIYTPLFNPRLLPPNGKLENDLNFRESNPIEGTFKINAKGDLIVYWTDDLNPPRAFNVDRQLRESGTSTHYLYGITSLKLKHINILNLFPYSGLVPTIKLGEVFSASAPTYQTAIVPGGGLLTGAYHLALAYVDVDNVATPYLTVSSPVSIVAEFDSVRPTTKKDGDKEGTQTSKAISWEILDVNPDYKYIRPVVIRKMGDAIEAYRLNDLEIDLNTATPPAMSDIVFSSLENVSPASVEDVIIDTVSYDTAKTINQLDGVLYLGNLTGSKDVGFQKYANNIKLRSKLYKIDKFDEYWATADGLHTGFANSPVDENNLVLEDRSYRYIPNASNYRGYQRDEVYAFYLAFIMNDGSMSYAYHIPGREPITTGVDYNANYFGSGLSSTSEIGTAPSNLLDSYSKTAKMYQFYDTTTFMTNNATRVMQYWENQNEVYPKNENYEVWDATDTQVGNIKGKNVRHHHFPSNENSDRCSVSSGIDSVVMPTVHHFGDWDAVAAIHYQGTFYVPNTSDSAALQWTWYTVPFGPIANNAQTSGILPPPLAGNVVTATVNNTQVRIRMHLKVHNDASAHDRDFGLRIERRNAGSTTWNYEPYNTTSTSGCCCGNAVAAYNSHMANNIDMKRKLNSSASKIIDTGQNNWVINLDSGDSIRVKWASSDPNNKGKLQTNNFSYGNRYNCDYNQSGSWVRFIVSVDPDPVDLTDYNDVKVSHQARALGFRLSDIHIPQKIADKVQGFRIFRAKREHSNRTILGQSIGIPMEDQFGIIGLCQEATGNAHAMQNLSVASDREEFFLNKNPWAKAASEYPNGYESISFHDFYLLRTKNSLAPATHLKMEYKVKNFAWNGPDLDQDKKMLTEITTGSSNTSTGAYEVAERWGWDDSSSPQDPENSNCYPQKINSAIFIGNSYHDGSTLSGASELNRALGQKAKSYILGDSIFGAEALGFGGKVVNLSGESSIILGLADKSALPALTSITDGGSGVTQYFGFNHEEGAGPLLVSQGYRSESYILNLKAYKTDVYKSIDSNELVFTGFEVKGEDLNNFIIGGSYETASADFTTDTVQQNPNSVLYKSSDNSSGIFGGDIFLARYGFASALSPQNTEQPSNPLRAVYSHIVESSDNIALRHAESKDSEYFPNTPATEMLKMVGTENGDFTYQDNVKYNSNYSTDNDIKPAFPLPVTEGEQTDFPTRTHRSAKNDTTSFIDNYRIFLANQFKDLPKNRGELWKLSTFNNLLYFHMEESLYAAKGKQSMQMKDGSEAYVGSGDIFQQDPDEIMQTEGGYGGTQSQYAALTTRYGYFFIDQNSKKIFLMKDKLSEISSIGMEDWFQENMPYILSRFGLTPADNPIESFGYHSVYDPENKRIILTKREIIPTTGFTDRVDGTMAPSKLTTDPSDKGTNAFLQNFFGLSNILYVNGSFYYAESLSVSNSNCGGGFPIPGGCHAWGPWIKIPYTDTDYFEKGGWTISYYPELNIWGSFHDYIPYHYFNTSTNFYSLVDKYPIPAWVGYSTPIEDHVGTTIGNIGIWKHNHTEEDTVYHPGEGYGVLYQENREFKYTDEAWLTSIDYHPFEFEFIHNEYKGETSLLASIQYTLEVFNQNNISVLEHGFTSYFLYNSFQASGESILEYLINTRYIGNSWKINNFRDMAAVVDQNGFLGNPNTSSYYTSTNPNVIGGLNIGTLTTSTINDMFIYDGMFKAINPLYLDLTKSWDQKRKFMDKWVGIRLIYDNITNNLLNLYSTSTNTRKASR